jgi:hypothetical protein
MCTVPHIGLSLWQQQHVVSFVMLLRQSSANAVDWQKHVFMFQLLLARHENCSIAACNQSKLVLQK